MGPRWLANLIVRDNSRESPRKPMPVPGSGQLNFFVLNSHPCFTFALHAVAGYTSRLSSTMLSSKSFSAVARSAALRNSFQVWAKTWQVGERFL